MESMLIVENFLKYRKAERRKTHQHYCPMLEGHLVTFARFPSGLYSTNLKEILCLAPGWEVGHNGWPHSPRTTDSLVTGTRVQGVTGNTVWEDRPRATSSRLRKRLPEERMFKRRPEEPWGVVQGGGGDGGEVQGKCGFRMVGG